MRYLPLLLCCLVVELVAQVPAVPLVKYGIGNSGDAPPPADPTDGIAVTERPSAGPTGAAELSHPIKLPPARMGHLPALEIGYNSDHLYGWLGRGWNLQLPALEVDTRWGVPRYDPANETETYSLNGAMLAPVAHRGPTRARSADAVFHRRVEGGFERITRHGSKPADYWWEVAYPDGSIDYYGGSPGEGTLREALLQDPAGNIASWALVRSLDPYGNRIDYHYVRQEDPGRTMSPEMGQQRYPARITYNGFADEEGNFTVRFVRDRELGEARRPDVRIDLSLGLKQVTADLLRRIDIDYRGERVRHYELDYRTGAFGQQLLTALTEYGGDGSRLAGHEFTYFEREEDDAFGEVEEWNTGQDKLSGPLINPLINFANAVSPLGSARSTNGQIGSALTVGPYGPLATKDWTAGGTVGGGQSASEGLLALVDINGDLLPDKVFRNGDRLYWRRNRAGEGLTDFGPRRAIAGIREFSAEKTTEINVGAEANVTPFSLGYQYSTSRSKTTTYFGDFNGDDLLDIRHGNRVYFNHLDADGNPTFTTSSADTPSPIVAGGSPDPALVQVDPAEQQALIEATPRHDVVRSWEAPFDGTVSVDGLVELLKQAGIDEYTREDGVRVRVELGGMPGGWSRVLWEARIPDNDYAPRPVSLSGISIRAGQRLYFRVQSVFDGAYDRVGWDPVITYAGRDTSARDVNGRPVYRYRASEDFLLASHQTVTMPLAGRVALRGTFSKPPLLDTLHLELLRNDRVVFSRAFAPDTSVHAADVRYEIAVAEKDELQLRLRAGASVDWTALHWEPVIAYRSADDGTPVLGGDGSELYRYVPAVSYTMRTRTVRPAVAQRVAAGAHRLHFTARLGTPISGIFPVTLSVRSRDTVYAQVDTLLSVAVPARLPLTMVRDFRVPAADTVWVEVFGPHELAADLAAGTIVFSDGSLLSGPPAVYRTREDENLLLGPQYRGWGQFAYRGEGLATDLGINERDLKLPEVAIDTSDLDEIEIDPDDPDFSELDDIAEDPSQQPFAAMVVDAAGGYWVGYDDLTRVGSDYQSSSRLGEDDVLLAPDLGTGSTAPELRSVVRVHAVMAGVSYGPLGLTGSYATATVVNELDIMDLNGDRYPDLVTPTAIQYTTSYGGLTDRCVVHTLGGHEARSHAIGGTAGGGFVHSSPSNSGDASGKGSRRRSRRARAKTKNQGSKAQSANESAESSASISVEFSVDNDHTLHSWFDINGDGLIDKVYAGGEVALNYGYRFGARENWGFDDIRRGQSRDYGGGVGFSYANNSIAAGVALSRTDNFSTDGLQDVNNDGMADALSYDEQSGRLRVALNTGTGFAAPVIWTTLSTHLDQGDATAESLNGAFTVCIPIPFIGIRVCVNPSGSVGQGVSRVLGQLVDVDGDGFLDEIRGREDDRMHVRRSTIGKTNLLREVRRPLGATLRLDYALAPADYGLPYAKVNLAEVMLDDGVDGDGPRWRKSRLSYHDPVRDRDEREFLGYGRVVTTDLDTERGDAPYRHSVMEYSNDHYYSQGLPRRFYLEDTAGRRYDETVYTYAFIDPVSQAELAAPQLVAGTGRVFPALREERDRYYEGAAEAGIERRTTYAYDLYGQIDETTEYGNGQPEDELRTVYTYYPAPVGRYQTNRIREVSVYLGGRRVRHSEQDVDERGNVRQLRQYLDDGTYATRDFTYDAYSNLTEATEPPNAAGERLVRSYTIDEQEHMHPVRIENSYGYASTARYEYRYGQLLEQTDVNGHRLSFELDAHGRIRQMTLPKDSVYSQRYTHHPDARPPYATTELYDPATGESLRRTVIADGLGRRIQQQEQAIVDGQERTVIDGWSRYDAFDRSVERIASAPLAPNISGFYMAPATAPTSYTQYDVQDRATEHTTAAGHIHQMDYGIREGPDGQLRFARRLTDPLGYRETQLTNEWGRPEVLLREADTSTITTVLDYNALGELLGVTDDGGFTTSYGYDQLGRRIREQPANADGPTELRYDLAGNLMSKLTPNLRELMGEDGGIRYHYEFQRLTGIDYPINFQNKVELTYGAAGAPHNRAGRLVLRQDASGGEELFYDAHGEVTKSIRTLLVNEATVRTFVHEVTYDSWGRERRMGYPDGEWLEYTYDAGGRLRSLHGEKLGNRYDYLRDARYDHRGRLIGAELGNGVREATTFDPLTQRPTELALTGPEGPLQQLSLTFDPVGNLEVRNQTAGPTANGLGGTDRQQFAYDPLYRLTEATGELSLTDGTRQYTYFADHDDRYNTSRRELTLTRDGHRDSLRSYDRALELTPNYPHRIARLGGRRYAYDANGNQTGYAGEAGSYRFQATTWDEEDRMMAFSDNGSISRYTYTADGRRAIRSSGRLRGVFTDGAPADFVSHTDDYIAYVSPFFSFTKTTYTKNYYLGDRILTSKQGTGEFNNIYWYRGDLTAGNLNYTARIEDLRRTVWNYYAALGTPPGPPTLPGYYAQPGQTGDPLPTAPAGNYASAPPTGRPGPQGPSDPNGPPGPPTWYRAAPSRDSVGAGYGYEGYGAFPEVVATFYHPDQSGNISWATDARGRAKSFRAYLPSGELLAEQARTAPVRELALNGKEQDAATGLYYYGARYLETETGRWLSRDPLAEEFPGHNPYNFALDNPLRFVDPDGRAPYDLFYSEEAANIDFNRIYNPRSIRKNREYGTLIYKTTVNGTDFYRYGKVAKGGRNGLRLPKKELGLGEVVADAHTHSGQRAHDHSEHYNNFSQADIDGNNADRRPGNLHTPNGTYKRYDPATGEISIIADDLARDRAWYNGQTPERTAPRTTRRFRRFNTTRAPLGGGALAVPEDTQVPRNKNRKYRPRLSASKARRVVE